MFCCYLWAQLTLTVFVGWSLSQREQERDAHVKHLAEILEVEREQLDDQAQQLDALRQADEQKAQQLDDQALQIQELRVMIEKMASK